MGSSKSPGFTIIEVMLFLAITGLMVAGILASASSSLNAQRYRDGVESIKSMITNEYAKVYSLTNSRDRSDPCGMAATSAGWGASDCLYTGRLVEIEQPGGAGDYTMTVRPVIASEDESAPLDNLFTRFRYETTSDAELVESRALGWGLSAVSPGGGSSPTRVAILILRSPLDGTVRTYNLLAGNSSYVITDNNLNTDIVGRTETETNPAVFCVADLAGPLDPAVRHAIVVAARATSAADVEIRLGDGEGSNPTC